MQITHSVWMALNLVLLIHCVSTRLSGSYCSIKAGVVPVSQPVWGCAVRYQAAFPRLTRVIKALCVTAPCAGCAAAPRDPGSVQLLLTLVA